MIPGRKLFPPIHVLERCKDIFQHGGQQNNLASLRAEREARFSQHTGQPCHCQTNMDVWDGEEYVTFSVWIWKLASITVQFCLLMLSSLPIK